MWGPQRAGHPTTRANMSNVKAIALVALLCVASAVGGCAPSDRLYIGNGASIVVPVPAGFVPIGGKVPDFRKFTESKMPVNAELIEYYLLRNDFNNVVAGYSKMRKRSLYVALPRPLAMRPFSESDFEASANDVRLNYGKLSSEDETEKNDLALHRTLDYGVPLKRISNERSLGVFLDVHDAIGAATVDTIEIKGRKLRHVGASAIMRVNNRAVTVEASSIVDNGADVGWAEDVLSHWVADILKANR